MNLFNHKSGNKLTPIQFAIIRGLHNLKMFSFKALVALIIFGIICLIVFAVCAIYHFTFKYW